MFLSGSLEEDEAREILAEFLLCVLLAVPPLVKWGGFIARVLELGFYPALMSINYTSHKWGLQLMQQPGYNTLRRYNYMTIWGMPICSCLFQAVNRTAGKKALLSVLGCVRLRPVRRVRRDSVSAEDRPNYASSVSRQLGPFPCGARKYIREDN